MKTGKFLIKKIIYVNLIFIMMIALDPVKIYSQAARQYSPNSKDDSASVSKPSESESLGIGDLIIDHTQSKWGKDFVDLFNKNWNPPENIGDYTIIIEEKPLPRFGTVILIKVNGNYIFQKFIQPRYETIKMNAEQGTQYAFSYLVNYEQIQKDLQGEDLKGTGIY